MANKRDDVNNRRIVGVFLFVALLTVGGIAYFMTLPTSKEAAENLARHTLIDAKHLSYRDATNVIVHSSDPEYSTGWGTADVTLGNGVNQAVTFAYKHVGGMRTFLYPFEDWIQKDIARKLDAQLENIHNIQIFHSPIDFNVTNTELHLAFEGTARAWMGRSDR